MKVDFTFKHVDTSEAFMSCAQEKIEKLSKFSLKPMEVSSVMSLARHECVVEVCLIEGRRKFKATACSDDFYRSLEMVINKLTRQLSKDKRRLKGHKSPERSVYGKIARLTPQLESEFSVRSFRKVG